MRAQPRAEIAEPRLIALRGSNILNPADRFVCDVFGEVVTLFGRLWLWNRARASVKSWVILVGFTLIESVEVIKPQSSGPTVERARRADFALGRVVPFTEHGRCISIVAQDLSDQGRTLGDDPCVPGKPGAHFDHGTGASAVVISPCKQCGASLRALCRRVKTVVDQTFAGKLIQVRRWHWTAKRAAHSEADIIEDDQ